MIFLENQNTDILTALEIKRTVLPECSRMVLAEQMHILDGEDYRGCLLRWEINQLNN